MISKRNRPLRILVAPGPYKECLDAREVASAMKAGIENLLPDSEIVLRPMADGGSGFLSLLTEAAGGRLVSAEVMSPIGESIKASFGMLGDGKTAVVESATAGGLALVPLDRRNPLLTTTYGVGQLIAAAIDHGAQRVLIGCGDSGTNDCGIGCAAALGVQFFKAGSDVPLDRPAGGDLRYIDRINVGSIPKRFSSIQFVLACNLTSVLCGAEGTSHIYGPQKGATPDQVKVLHHGVEHFCDLVFETTGVDLAFVPGAGGSGGLAACLYGMFGARLLYSLDVVDQYLRLDNYLNDVDLVLTGEGCIDDRTASGKIACGVALRAKRLGIPVVAIVGSIAADHEDIFFNGIDAVECIATGPIAREDSISNAAGLITQATERVIRFVGMSKFSQLTLHIREAEQSVDSAGVVHRVDGAISHRPIEARSGLVSKRTQENLKLAQESLPAVRIKAWIFDLGNTLMSIPTEFDEERCIQQILGMNDQEEVRSIIYRLCFTHVGQTVGQFLDRFNDAVCKPSQTELRSNVKAAWLTSTEKAQLSKGAWEALDELRSRGQKLALVSNTPPTSHLIVDRLGLRHRFDEIVFSCDTGYLKPDPRIFRVALDRLGVSPNEAIVVGDKIRTDILGGAILGLKTILLETRLRRSIENDQNYVDAIISSLDDLPNTSVFRAITSPSTFANA